jgi:mono/diheme cytochrome c family protein
MCLTVSRNVFFFILSPWFPIALETVNDVTTSTQKNFMKRVKPGLLIGGAVIAIGAAGLGFIDSGVYDVSASSGHNPLVAWVLHDTYEHSLHRHAENIVVPADLVNEANVRAGARLYNSTCIYCHGAPGRQLGPIGQGILPLAPSLLAANRRNNPKLMFWVIKYGVKMTGMPAFGKTQDDQTLWQLAAFLEKGRGISAQDYDALAPGPGETPSR